MAPAAEIAVLIGLSVVLMAVFVIALQQTCSASPKKQNMTFRVLLTIGVLSEIIILFVESLSLYFDKVTNHWLIDVIFWCSVYSLSFVVYHLVPFPKRSEQEVLLLYLHRCWLAFTVAYFVWISMCCVLLYVTQNVIFYDAFYIFGLLLYLCIGCVHIFFISYNVRLTINNSLYKINKSSSVHYDDKYHDYIYNEDDVEQPPKVDGNQTDKAKQQKPNAVKPSIHRRRHPPNSNIGANGSNLPMTSPVMGRRPTVEDLKSVDPIITMLQLSKARYMLTLYLCLTLLVLLLIMFAVYWRIATLTRFYTPTAPIPHHSDLLWYQQLDIFVFHEIFVVILYFAGIGSHWIRLGQSAPDSLGKRCSSVLSHVNLCHAITVKTGRRNRVASASARHSISKPQQNAPATQGETKTNDHEFANDNAEHTERTEATKRRVSLKTMEVNDMMVPLTPDIVFNNDNNIMTPSTVFDRIALAQRAAVYSYTNQTANRLPSAAMELSLHAINSTGKEIGKRGMAKPHKIDPEQDPQPDLNERVLSIVDEREQNMQAELDVDEKALQASKPTLKNNLTDFSGVATQRENSEDSSSTDSGDIGHGDARRETPVDVKSPSTAEFVDEILRGLSMAEKVKEEMAISVVVFEFADVICTNIGKLHGKMAGYVESMTHTQKELCFGGQERLQCLTNFLKELHTQPRGVKTFVIADEQSKMLVRLLNDTHLLKYFVSRSPSNADKLFSHVIGWDHSMAKEASGKTHLILLKLLKLLQKEHDELLYVGNESDKEVIQHLRQIQICKTFCCQTHGLTATAMQKIQQKYFE